MGRWAVRQVLMAAGVQVQGHCQCHRLSLTCHQHPAESPPWGPHCARLKMLCARLHEKGVWPAIPRHALCEVHPSASYSAAGNTQVCACQTHGVDTCHCGKKACATILRLHSSLSSVILSSSLLSNPWASVQACATPRCARAGQWWVHTCACCPPSKELPRPGPVRPWAGQRGLRPLRAASVSRGFA